MQFDLLSVCRPARDLGDQGDGSGTISCAEEVASATRNGAMALDFVQPPRKQTSVHTTEIDVKHGGL